MAQEPAGKPLPDRVNAAALQQLDAAVTACRACPRLVAWREQVAHEKRRAFSDQTYWGKPVPGFGDPGARLVLLGLAPAAHGANRTGRMFTGDESGVWLYRALHRAGLANQPTSTHALDGLLLQGCRVLAAARCAPPDNKPTREELQACSGFLATELSLLTQARVVLCLGKIAWDTYVTWARAQPGAVRLKKRPTFAHGACVEVGFPHVLMGSYHPSQQNTFTGRLTQPMLDQVLSAARDLSRR